MMKKRAIFLASVLLISVFLSGCSEGKGEDPSGKSDQASSSASDSASSADSSKTSDVSKEDSVKESELLLMKSFGELWMSDNFYIDVVMTSKYDPSAVSSASVPADSSDRSGSGIVTVTYTYTIEADRVNDIAGLNMISDMGNLCTLVKENKLYTIDHASKTYTTTPYEGSATDYAGQYTTKVCLGAVNNCVFQNTGKTQYKGNNVTFERYKLEHDDETESASVVGDTYVEYYFDSLGKPVAEMVQASSGNITFDFVRISDQIEVKDMLKIPDGYKEVKETG